MCLSGSLWPSAISFSLLFIYNYNPSLDWSKKCLWNNQQSSLFLSLEPTKLIFNTISLSFALFASGSLRNPVHMTLELCLKTGSLPYHQLFNFGSYRTSSVLMAAGTWFRCTIFFSHGITGLSPGLSQFGFVLLLFDLPMVQSTPGFQLVVDWISVIWRGESLALVTKCFLDLLLLKTKTL